MKTLQKVASIHASTHNHFSHERHLIDRQTYKTRRAAALPSGSRSWPEKALFLAQVRLAETSCG
jgi:hypothetical protein